VQENTDDDMPIYEYQCQKCHHQLEALQKFSDKPLRECPECGKHTLLRLMSAPMFRLAGSGWYETDFKSDKENKRNLAGKDDGPPIESPVPAATGENADKTDKAAKVDTKAESKTEPAATPKSAAARKPVAKPTAKPVVRTKPVVKKAAPKKAARKR
jgi:putative FmdB family regulatory protein